MSTIALNARSTSVSVFKITHTEIDDHCFSDHCSGDYEEAPDIDTNVVEEEAINCTEEEAKANSEGAREGRNNGKHPPSLKELIEPWKHVPVPNHLLETKIFAKHSENDLVCAIPAYVQFAGFQPGKILYRRLELLNKSRDAQRFHIIPPQSKYFGIKYKKDRRLVPGLSVSCIVEFYPDQSRYFYDCIRVHCEGDDNLIIPVHAFPVLDVSQFPKIIDFPPVPIGQSQCKSFRLRSVAPVSFNFQLICIDGSPSFTVEPLCGTVPANEDVSVHVTFSPNAFITATMRIKLDVSQFVDFSPMFCTITGRSYPGLTAEKELTCGGPISNSLALKDQKNNDGATGVVIDPVCVTPLDLARRRKQQQQQLSSRSNKVTANPRSGQDSRRQLNQRSTVVTQVSNRQTKEIQFEAACREELRNERHNQLRWQTKLGADPVTADFRAKVFRERMAVQQEKEVTQSTVDAICGRTTRDPCKIVEWCPTFDVFVNDPWWRRQRSLDKFIRAASKIIIRYRMCCRLQILKQYLASSSVSPSIKEICRDVTGDAVSCSDQCSSQLFQMTTDKVTERIFPTELRPRQADVLDALALGTVATMPNEIMLREHINYFPLKVCPQYKLLGYNRHSVEEAAHSYVPSGLPRRLRTGAEDELVIVDIGHITQHQHCDLPAHITTGLVQTDRQGAKSRGAEGAKSSGGECQGRPLLIVAPSGLYEPIRYHPLHIFNPVPGLQTYQSALPYSEVDSDYHLCPLPRFPALSSLDRFNKSTQKHFLDREDVIKCVMSWRKFPSLTIASSANVPSLINIWVPSWSDPFNTDLLPLGIPVLQCCLAEDDQKDIIDNRCGGEPVIALNPEIVSAEFKQMSSDILQSNPDLIIKPEDMNEKHLPATNIPYTCSGPIPRERREQHLIRYLQNKRQTLRRQIEARVDDVLTRKDSYY